MHHLQTVCEGKEEGRGLLQIEATYQAEIINIAEYLNTKYKTDQFVNIVKRHESNQPNMNSTIKVNVAEELNQSNVNSDTQNESIQHIKTKQGESLKRRWENKVMHGHYIRSMDRQLISEEDTFLCLSREDRKGKSESEIISAQDQTLQTKYRATNLLPKEIDSKCRYSKQFDETMEHIISSAINL